MFNRHQVIYLYERFYVKLIVWRIIFYKTEVYMNCLHCMNSRKLPVCKIVGVVSKIEATDYHYHH